jgi:hypothetical protein
VREDVRFVQGRCMEDRVDSLYAALDMIPVGDGSDLVGEV